MENELTLRDLYDVLARYRRLLLVLPLLCAALAFGLSKLLPHQYQAKAVIAVNVSAAPPDQDLFNFDPKLLPSPGALLSAYEQAAQARLAQAWNISADTVTPHLDTGQDQDSGALTLSASDSSARGAQRRAQQAAADFQDFVGDVVSASLKSSLQATASGLQAQLSSDQQSIAQLRTLLKATPATLPGLGQSTVRDQLQAAGVDPRYAGLSDVAANPASTLLNVQLASTQARIVGEEANLARLKALLNSSSQQLTLSHQMIQVNLLSDPAFPDKTQGLSSLAVAILVYLLVLLLSVLGALLHHAVRGPAVLPGGSRHLATGD